MPGVMPYVMEKGPYLSVIEYLLEPDRRVAALQKLRAGVPIADLVGFHAPGLDPDGRTEATRKQHLRRDWFGAEDAQDKPTTGFWQGYNGDVEAIVREGVIRAIEVAAGLDHPAGDGGGSGGPSPVATRRWPISVYWVCQGPWFQSWVTWQRDPEGTGHVTLTLCTPAATGYPLNPRITRNVAPGDPKHREYASPPASDAHEADRGMWVIGHEDYQRVVQLSLVPADFGTIVLPAVTWRPKAEAVVCVAPAEWEGGVLAAGRTDR